MFVKQLLDALSAPGSTYPMKEDRFGLDMGRGLFPAINLDGCFRSGRIGPCIKQAISQATVPLGNQGIESTWTNAVERLISCQSAQRVAALFLLFSLDGFCELRIRLTECRHWCHAYI